MSRLGEGGQSLMGLPPISLSSQFRQVYLQQPVIAPIVRAELLARGFGNPKTLTTSIVAIIETFYKICSSGFRPLPKLTIVREIFSRLPDGAKVDQIHIASAIYATMKAILPDTDMDIFGPYVREHFPEGPGDQAALTLESSTNQEEPTSQFESQLANRIENRMWPMVIGPPGSGKTTTIMNAISNLKPVQSAMSNGKTAAGSGSFSYFEVMLARHSVEELFGHEDETSKWNFGIISRFLSANSKPCVIVLVTPISTNVAHILSSMFDRGFYETDRSHSFAIPKQIRFVFETANIESVSPLLLARCSLMFLPHMDATLRWSPVLRQSPVVEETLKVLIAAVAVYPLKEDLQRMTGKMRQLEKLYMIMAAKSDNDDISLVSNLLYAFCWSFGATLQSQGDVRKFDAGIRTAINENDYLQNIGVLEKGISVFQQKFDRDLKKWVAVESSLDAVQQVIELLVENDEPILLVGDLETRILLRAIESKWDDINVVKTTPGSQMTKETCMAQILSHLCYKGEHYIQPKDNTKMLWIIKRLETRQVKSEGCLLSTLADIAKNMTIYSRAIGFRRKKFRNIAILAQVTRSKGMQLFTSFEGLNNFCVLAAKECMASTIIAAQNIADDIPEDMLEATAAIHQDLTTTFSAASVEAFNPVRIMALTDLDSLVRCLKFSPDTDEDTSRFQWTNSIIENIVQPLWTLQERQKVTEILQRHGVNVVEDNADDDTAFDRVVTAIERAISLQKRLIVLVGVAGVGKRSAIIKCCQEGNINLNRALINPLTMKYILDKEDSNQQQACIVNGLLFTKLVKPEDTDKYVHALKLNTEKCPNLTMFFSLSISDYNENILKRLLDHLKHEGGTIIGVPEWTEQDLLHCSLENRALLKIHMAIEGFSKRIHSQYTPTPAMLALAYKVTDSRIKTKADIIAKRSQLLENVLKQMEALDQLVESSQQQLANIDRELSTDQERHRKMAEDVESTKLNLETTSEQKTSLSRQIPDFNRQVDVRKHDLQVSSQKRHAVYDKAVEVLREKSTKDIEKFCSRQSVSTEVEVICSAILVITEGMKYPESGEAMYVWNNFRGAFVQEDWRQQFYSIDPERHGTVTAFFLERRLKELRKLGLKRAQLAKEEPIADALIEFCEGFLEIINTVEERIELESRLKVYEEMFANMNAEVERLQTTENTLNEQLQKLTESMTSMEGKMKILETEINDRRGKLEMAQEIATALEQQRNQWVNQLHDLQSERASLEERETVMAAASIYLMELPQAQRETGLGVIEDAAGCSGAYSHLSGTFDPCHRKNILNQQQLPGWEERLIKRLCVVYDPHNILLDLFTGRDVSLHYIEELADLEAINEVLSQANERDTLVLNFGSNAHVIFDVVAELRKMCSRKVAVFLCLSQWTPLPSRVTFVNLDMRGKEVRRMALHLFKVKEGRDDTADKIAAEEDVSRKLDTVETQLMSIIMSPESLTHRHKDIVQLSGKLKDFRATRRASRVNLDLETEQALQGVGPEMLFPIAIIAACCDMVSIANQPFMSLSQFVHFTLAKLRDTDDVEEAHRVIFQRYCLAFSDKDQLLFQTLIILHHKILNGSLTDADFGDFVNVIGGHEKKEFPIQCPDWCEHSDWHNLKKIVSEKNYHLATVSLEENEEIWHDWYDNAVDQTIPVLVRDQEFAHLLIRSALRPRLLPIHIGDYVGKNASPEVMSVPANLCLDYVHSFSTSISPILLFIDNNAIEDPTFHLKKLADVQGIASTKVKYFALGAGNGSVACSLLDTAFVRGQWLIFQNLQLVPNIIVALQRRIDEAKDIHEDFRLWFTWQHEALPQLQLLQRSIVINCQPIRAIRYHSNMFVYSLRESIFEVDSTNRSIMSCLLNLHRRWEWSKDYAPFYWHAAFRLHSTNIMCEMSSHTEFFSTETLSTTSGGVRRRITGEQLHDRLTRFLSFIYSQYVHDKCDLSTIELEVGEALLTLLVDEIVLIDGNRQELKDKLCHSLMPAIQAPGKIAHILRLPRTADAIFNRSLSATLQRHVGRLVDQVNRWYFVSFSHEDLVGKAHELQEAVESFYGTDYSEDTIYRESIDELVLIREKKQFQENIFQLMVEVIYAFDHEHDQKWYLQLCTPMSWQRRSGVRNRRLNHWLDELQQKVNKFLGDVEPVDLGWLYDPLRYLSAVSIRHLISANLGTNTEFLITLSGIKDIHELKEGLHAGCYTTGIYLFGATWTSNELGPIATDSLASGNEVLINIFGLTFYMSEFQAT
jgi:flagellar biosynthesis GTPase FlhF/predicted  nucleic acid-binding Zn-ribbon protein